MTPPPPPAGVRCPRCGGRTQVLYTRHRPGGVTARVRRCRDCGHRVRTRESA